MDSNSWQRIKQYYHRIVEEEPSRWRELLADVDQEVAPEVAKLLFPDEAALALLGPAQFALKSEPEQHLPIGTEIAGFTIVGELGSGGMGRVYHGVRKQRPADLQVAIKVLKKGLFSSSMIADFQKESEILSYLNHANIARCYQAGLLAGDQPYFVMEYVEGIPIDRFCDQQGLSLTERVELFCQVCDAITYAHQNLVIHRDIKPSNILVTPQGRIKLMDFGIAKIVQPKPEAKDTGGETFRAYTPGYGSPEQLAGRNTTTATDIYSLGVLLCKILTGNKSPNSTSRNPSTHRGDWLAAVTSRPSRWVLEAEEGPSRHSFLEGLGLSAERLARSLAGDLDWIILRAVAEEISDRYSSSERLATDLKRYLGGYPVQGQERSQLYVLGKFIKRNRMAVAAGAVSLLVIVGFTVLLGVQWRRAERNLTRAQVISSFLEDLFQQADPFQSGGRQPDAKDLLDQGLAKIEAGSVENPETRAAILHTMASAYYSLSQRSRARQLFKQAYELRRQTVGDEHPDTADSLSGLADIYLNSHQLELAEEAMNRILEIYSANYQEDHVKVLQITADLADLYSKQHQFDRSEAYFERALMFMHANSKGKVRALRGNVLNNFALMKRDQGELARAEELHRQALAEKRIRLGPDHPGVANALNDLAVLLRLMDRLVEAEPFLVESYSLTENAFGDANEKTLTVANNLATNLGGQGRNEEAEAIYRDSLAALDQGSEPKPGLAVTILNNLSKNLMDRGLVYEAEYWLEEGRNRFATWRSQPPITALILMANRAELHGKQNRFDLAEPLFDKALARVHELFGKNHPATAKVQYKRALAFARVGCHNQAFEAYAHAFSIREQKLGLGHGETLACFRDWAKLTRNLPGRSASGELRTIWERMVSEIRPTSHAHQQELIEEIAAIFAEP